MNIELLKPDEEELFILLGKAAEQENSPWIEFSTIAEKLKIDEQRIRSIVTNFYEYEKITINGEENFSIGKYYDSDRNMTMIIPRPSCIELARKIQAKRRRKPDYFAKAFATIKSKRWIAIPLLAAIVIGWLIGIVGGIIAIFR